jgi:hypothetical protein
LAKILETQTYGDLVAAGGGYQRIQATEVNGRQLVDDDRRLKLSLLAKVSG